MKQSKKVITFEVLGALALVGLGVAVWTQAGNLRKSMEELADA